MLCSTRPTLASNTSELSWEVHTGAALPKNEVWGSGHGFHFILDFPNSDLAEPQAVFFCTFALKSYKFRFLAVPRQFTGR